MLLSQSVCNHHALREETMIACDLCRVFGIVLQAHDLRNATGQACLRRAMPGGGAGNERMRLRGLRLQT